MPTQVRTVAILAGEGELPLQLVNYCLNNNIPCCAVQFKGCYYDAWPNINTLQTRLEKVGEIFRFFKKHSVTDIVMIGNLKRPSLKTMRPDLRGLKTLGKIAGTFAKGDDNLLRSLRQEIEDEGFTVRGIDYYVPDLTASCGLLTKKQFSCNDSQFLNRAIDVAIQHGMDDKGQSILAHKDGSYACEGPDGTTALIEKHGQSGSILVKMMKPQQDPDLDRPTVGLHTLKMLKEKNCSGMVLQANAVFLVNKDQMIAYADEAELFIEAVNA